MTITGRTTEAVSAPTDGTTALRGRAVEQAAVHGALQRVCDTGLPLTSVTRLDAEQPRTSTHPPR